jgi:outer membrane receptor protein involved in Fe transport
MKKIVGIFAVVLMVASAPAFAALTGTMSGVVKDKAGAPLPGVSVTVTSPVLQGSRVAVTNNDGTYRLPTLPPGVGYKAVFALPGFKGVTRAGFEVSLNEDTQVNALLELSDVQTEVVVTGEAPAVDITQTSTQQNYNSDYLRKIAVGIAGRSYQSVIAAAPGVVGTGNVNALGGSSLDNAFLIDGVTTTDPVTHTFSTNMNYDTIQEVNVQTSGYQAEYGRGTGAIVNVVTKSGGNEFSGSLDLRYSSNKLNESGDHYDHNFSEARDNTWGATLGGPVVKDAVWLFANVQRPDNFITPATTNPTVLADNPNPPIRGFKGWNWGLKASFTLSPQLSGFGYFSDSKAAVSGATNSVAYRPEATYTQDQKTQLYTLKLYGVFNSNWIGELQAGKNAQTIISGPSNGNDALSYDYNRLSGVVWDSYSNHQGGDRNRTQAGLSTSYFLNAMGNHEIKVGGNYDTQSFPSFNFTTGTPSDPSFCPSGFVCGATYQFAGFDASGNRIPYSQSVSTRAPTYEQTAKSMYFYAQDQWRPNPRLTINVGLRWDKIVQYNNQDLQVINFSQVQPRVSVAYDITGDGLTVARANYGQFYTEPGLTLIRGANTGIISAITRSYSWSTASKSYVFVRQTGGLLLSTPLVDPDIKPTYDDQFNFAIQRELVKGLSLTGTYFYKRTNRMFEDTCYQGAACTAYILTNNPGAQWGVPNPLGKDYYSYQLELGYRYSRGIVNASYVYSKSRGSTDAGATQYIGGDFDSYPQNFQNTFGYLPDDARNRFKLYGSYMIPFIETNLGVNYTYRSGFPYTIYVSDSNYGTIYQEPRGNSRGPVMHQLDFQLEKQFHLGFARNLSVSVIGACQNLFSSEQATVIQAQVGTANFLQATTWQLPRRWQLGFRVDF